MLHCPSNGATVFAMRHRKGLPKLNRPADQRKALLRSLTTEILRHGKITTTKVRAAWRRLCCLKHRCVWLHVLHLTAAFRRADLHRSLSCPQTKAKAARKYVDKMIQLAKDGSLHARRQVWAIC